MTRSLHLRCPWLVPGAVALVLVVAGVRASEAAAATACGPAPAGSAAVALVVDDGASPPLVRCVVVPARASGRAVLRAAGVPFRVGSGTAADNLQGGAFVCGLLGEPASGCATPSSSGGFDYWAYFRQPAGAAWTYSRVGFDFPVASDCAVEGWRRVRRGGVAAEDNPRPRVAPPAVRCDPVAPPPTAPASAARPPRPGRAPATTARPGPAVAPASSRSAGGPSSSLPATGGAAPAPVGPTAGATSLPAARLAPGPTVAPSGTASPPGPTTVPPPAVAGVTTIAPGTRAVERSAVTTAVPSSPSDDPARSEQAADARPDPSGSGAPWGLLAGVLGVAALGASAVVRARRQRSDG